ncbi:hypothetical protein ALC57_00133, partial [Trachymyrmex cornetzi]
WNDLIVSKWQNLTRQSLEFDQEVLMKKYSPSKVISKINDGALILTDLFYRLSLSRRAQIKPVLNLLAKNTADAIPVDNLLFGTSFGEIEILEIANGDIVKIPLAIPTTFFFKKLHKDSITYVKENVNN